MDRKHTADVAARFLKVMRYVIENRIDGITTGYEFAEIIGTHPQNISKIESGVRNPTVEMLCDTCLAFKINPAWILLGQGSEMFTKGSAVMEMGFLSRLNEIEKTLNIKTEKPKKKAS